MSPRYHPEEDMEMRYFRLSYRCHRDPASGPLGDGVSIIVQETGLLNAIIMARKERRDAMPIPLDLFAPCSDCEFVAATEVDT